MFSELIFWYAFQVNSIDLFCTGVDRADILSNVCYRLMHISESLDCVIDKVCGPAAIVEITLQ